MNANKLVRVVGLGVVGWVLLVGLATGAARAARFQVSTGELRFPDTLLGEQSTGRVRLENLTDDDIDISIELEDAAYWTGALVLTLPRQGQAFIDVTFKPVDGGLHRAYMRLTTDTPSDYFALSLLGGGTLAPVPPAPYEEWPDEACSHCSSGSGGGPDAGWAVLVVATWYAARHGRGRKRR